MIPQEKSAAVTLGLNETFGVAEFEDIRDLTDRPGSNRAFRIIVRGSAYLLRINTRPGDMKRHFTCMQAAADACIVRDMLVRLKHPQEAASYENQIDCNDHSLVVFRTGADPFRKPGIPKRPTDCPAASDEGRPRANDGTIAHHILA